MATPALAGAPCEPQRVTAEFTSFSQFGKAVDINGDLAVIGAPFHFHFAPCTCWGAVFVYRRLGSTWIFEQEMLAPHSSPQGADHFGGGTVAIEGDVIMVGASGHTHAGVGGGAVHVYRLNGSVWIHEQELLASDAALGDAFGASATLKGDTAIIGAPADDDLGTQSGSAYAFRHVGHAWVQQQKLLASDGATGDFFGNAVAFDGQTILIGAPGDDDDAILSGSVYAFDWNARAKSWVQVQKLHQPSPVFGGAHFGNSISMSSDSQGVRWAAIGTDNANRAFLFRNAGSNWQFHQMLQGTIPSFGEFGNSVSIDGDRAIVGDFSAWVYGGFIESGAAYTYRYDSNSWIPENTFVSPFTGAMSYGWAVALSGSTVLIGAPGEMGQAGAAYFIDLDPRGGPADLNCDGVVNGLDIGILLSQWNTHGSADLNGDRTVNGLDIGVLLSQWTV